MYQLSAFENWWPSSGSFGPDLVWTLRRALRSAPKGGIASSCLRDRPGPFPAHRGGHPSPVVDGARGLVSCWSGFPLARSPRMDADLMAIMGISGFGAKKNVRQLENNRYDKNKRVSVE